MAAPAAKPSTVQFSALAPTGTVSLADSFDAVFRSTISTEPTHNAEELAHTDHVVDETPEDRANQTVDPLQADDRADNSANESRDQPPKVEQQDLLLRSGRQLRRLWFGERPLASPTRL